MIDIIGKNKEFPLYGSECREIGCNPSGVVCGVEII